ncbi:MAG: hypothetical protein ACFFCF_07870 [Promethearchaeota archaeon]
MLLTLLGIFGMRRFQLKHRNHFIIINLSLLALATMETTITLWQPDYFYGVPNILQWIISILGGKFAVLAAFPFSVKIFFSAFWLEWGEYHLFIYLGNLPIINLQSPTVPVGGVERLLWMLRIRILAFPIVFLLNLTFFPIYILIQYGIHQLQSRESSKMTYHYNN